MALHPLLLISLIAAVAGSAGCKRGTPSAAPATAAATTRPTTAPAATRATTARIATDAVWTSQGHGFFLTGTLTEGTLRKGQSVTVHTSGGPVQERIERLESTDGQHAELSQASKGQKVSLFFEGSKGGKLSLFVPHVSEAQVSEGTLVTSDDP
jgi:translation elongation factor EF-1alpha